jgi:hypothetical protein
MKKKLHTLLVLIGLSFLVGASFDVKAQQLPEPVKNEEVVARERLEDEIEELKETYRGQLTEYRDADREFEIDKDQYHKLQTLASINKVTESARKAFALRDQVLITYFELQRSRIIASEGIELSLKESVVKRIEVEGRWLVDHKQRVEKMLDRTQFNSLADEFTEKSDDFEEASDQAAMILSLGDLQDVYDRFVLVRKDIFNIEAQSSNANRTRASKETDRMITEVKEKLEKTWVDLGINISKDKASSFSSNKVKNLDPIYSGLNKTASFLRELLREL